MTQNIIGATAFEDAAYTGGRISSFFPVGTDSQIGEVTPVSLLPYYRLKVGWGAEGCVARNSEARHGGNCQYCPFQKFDPSGSRYSHMVTARGFLVTLAAVTLGVWAASRSSRCSDRRICFRAPLGGLFELGRPNRYGSSRSKVTCERGRSHLGFKYRCSS